MPIHFFAQEAVPTNVLQNWNYATTIAGFFLVFITTAVGLIWRSALLSSTLKDTQGKIGEMKVDVAKYENTTTLNESKLVLLESRFKEVEQKAIDSRAEYVRQETLINAQGVRITLLESNYTRVVVDLHDLKELVQKIYDRVVGWDSIRSSAT